MKKYGSVLFITLLIVIVVGCGAQPAAPTEAPAAEAPAATQEPAAEAPAATEAPAAEAPAATEEPVAEAASTGAVAVGLALRKAGDR